MTELKVNPRGGHRGTEKTTSRRKRRRSLLFRKEEKKQRRKIESGRTGSKRSTLKRRKECRKAGEVKTTCA